VLDVCKAVTEFSIDADLVGVLDDSHLVTLADLALDFYRQVVASQSLDACFECINFILVILTGFTRDRDAHFVLLLAFSDDADVLTIFGALYS